jgi:hypothetical protein
MTKSITKTLIALAFLVVIFNNCGNNATNNVQTTSTLPPMTLPQDVANTCSVDDAAFAAWFADGKVTENGFVMPANSVTFDHNNNCSFYRWSEQMFLWLTSSGKKYEGGGTVLESPVFYVVTPKLPDGTRDLVEYKKGDPLDAAPNISRINTEEGQATDNVLLDKNGNIVYYITMVNDVYFALLKMAAKDASSVNRFPITQTGLDSIATFAQQNKPHLLEPNALAIELKTSWVKLEGDMKKEDFVTIKADIPIIKKMNNKEWLITEETEEGTLALVGMHIVGSANGHPEMIWSTFEHKSCTPNAKYQYVNTAGKVVDVAPDNSGSWLFNQNPADTAIAHANASYAEFKNDIIKAKGEAIKPSNTIRVLAWGTPYDATSNQEDTTSADANSQVIAINNSVINKLVGNDARKNYIFIGSTWTAGGVKPNGRVYNPTAAGGTDLASGVAIGTSSLSNSTMETDFQLSTPEIKAIAIGDQKNCFMCHGGGAKNMNPTENAPGQFNDNLSHVFYPLMMGLKPQPQPLKKKNK